MRTPPSEEIWRVRLVRTRIPWGSKPVRPAEIGDALCTALLAQENVLEDANYQKISPNQFVVEIGQANYARNFQLIEEQVIRQWSDKLLAYLLTANSRQGRQEYRFAGPLTIEILPVPDLGNDQARIRSRIQVEREIYAQTGRPAAHSACLETFPGGRRWALYPGMITIGRDPGCNIYLDSPVIQQKKLVSSQHAYLVCQFERCHLFDGAPNGTPSLNGTYVNLQRLSPKGVELKPGDAILLATLEPNHPNPDTPGVASLRFLQECS